MNAPAYLVLAGPPQTAWAYPLTEQRTVLGRERACHVNIVHPTISRRHCEVWVEGGKVYLQDLQSLNGVYVNGTRVRRRRLAFGDLVQIGPLVVQVIRGLADGERVLKVGFEDRSTTDSSTSHRTLALPSFTPVEQEVVKQLVEGHSEKEVASQLGLSQDAVHSHVKHIYRQLGISSRTQLVIWYWRGQAE